MPSRRHHSCARALNLWISLGFIVTTDYNALINNKKTSMSNIITLNLQSQQKYIDACVQKYNRAHNIRLVAVSKTKPIELIHIAYQAGQKDFGENYLQEALPKILALKDLPLTWHFIGRIQSNKARLLAQNFDWVQSVSSLKVAHRLDQYREENHPPLNICVQVNISEEEGKSGCSIQEVVALCKELRDYPRLALRGLMAIPAYTDDRQEQKRVFTQLAALFDQIKTELQLPCWDTLSMGMTGDMETAIEAGATMVRIGTAIFGSR